MSDSRITEEIERNIFFFFLKKVTPKMLKFILSVMKPIIHIWLLTIIFASFISLFSFNSLLYHLLRCQRFNVYMDHIYSTIDTIYGPALTFSQQSTGTTAKKL